MSCTNFLWWASLEKSDKFLYVFHVDANVGVIFQLINKINPTDSFSREGHGHILMKMINYLCL